ncbi:DinB family protein [Gorillibacterium sp. sgz5001074]|uniref:DinB family protein n=1 Tax=Gorillibacterium sp. sgz5001074 TaxID=3446695 RepID=UPI003F67838A
MFRTMDDFYQAWNQESDHTLKLLSVLTDESLSTKAAEGHRSLGYLAWHLTTTIHEMLSRTGLHFEAPEEDDCPSSAQDIAEAYRQASDNMITAMRESWNDNSLILTCNMYGEEWPNSQTLWVLVTHQIHHRGQMTVLMRQAGLAVPGIYGPSKEEWSAMGMEAPAL